MNDFRDEVYKIYFLLLLVVLAAIIFAVTPMVIYLNKTKEYTKQGLFMTGLQSVWLLFVNIICALGSADYLLTHYGQTNGIILLLLFAAFGGTVALGLYEVVLNQRLAIGRKIEQKVLSFLTTTPKEEEGNNEKS